MVLFGTMKIIFLDIDGVLNSADWFRRRTKEMQFSHNYELDPVLIRRFERLLKKTGAKVVLSSSWRIPDNWRERLEQQDLDTKEIIDRTPQLPRLINTGNEYCERGKEIVAWLKNHPEVTKFAILDDDSDFLPDQPLFQTTWEKGLTVEIVNDVINHFEV